MGEIDIVTVSSRGQIAIPSKIREKIGLEKGSKLLILEKNDQIYLRKIDPEAMEKSFQEILKPVKQKSREKGLDKKEATDLVQKTREKTRGDM